MEKVVDIKDKIRDTEQVYEDYYTKAFSPLDEASNETGYGVWNEETKAWLDLNTLKGLYFNEEWVYILIDRIASKIAAQELRVVVETYHNGEATYTPDENHPVQQLIYEPNDEQTYYQWMYSVVVDFCLAGNSIIYRSIAGPKLIHIPVEMVQLDFDTTTGKLNKYRIIQYNTNYEMPVPREVMSLDPQQVAHLRRPNPSSALWGLSPFIPARKSVLFNRYSMEYLNNFYHKGAQPGIILSMDDSTNEAAALRLLRSMEIAYTGRRNQRRNLVLPKGVKADSIAHTLADQQLKEYLLLNRETIINILQVPKHELSIAESGSLGSEEYKTALRNFWSGPLKSMMKSIEASLTKLFKNDLGDNRYLEFDLSDVEFLKEDLTQKADLGIKLLQTHTLNEVRAQIFNQPPLEGGDAPPVMKPIPQIGAPLPRINQDSAPLPEVKAETTTTEFEIAVTPHDEKRKTLDNNLKALDAFKEANPHWWTQRENAKRKDEAKHFSAIHESVLNLFVDQTVSAVKIVKSNLKKQGFKAFGRKDTYNKAELKRQIQDKLNQFAKDYAAGVLPSLEATLEAGYSAQLILPFGLPNRSRIEAIRSRGEQVRRDLLADKTYEAFSQINDTTTNKIMNIIDEGVANSRTLDEIAANIIKDVSDPDITNSRAMTITRTEVLSAASIGQAAAMQDASEVIPDLKKMWLNAGDDRVRGNPGGKYKNSEADHWSIGGEVVGHEDKFSNGLLFPHDPAGEAGEVINCRCDFTFFSAQDAEALGVQSLQGELDQIQGSDNQS